MNEEQLEKGTKLLRRITDIKKLIKYIEGIKDKNPEFRLLDGRGSNTTVLWPKSEVTETVTHLILTHWKMKLEKLEREFAEL